MTAFSVDFSRPPNAKELKASEARLARLTGSYGEAVERAAKKTQGLLAKNGPLIKHGFRVRHPFSYKNEPPKGDFSDRKVPDRYLRPPATRISSSRGSTLRLYLMALAVAQMTKTAGGRADSLPVTGDAEHLGWTDLVVTDAVNSKGLTYLTAKNKRARSIRTSLKALSSANLLNLAVETGHRGNFENYDLLDETGGVDGEVDVYKVPGPKDSLITLPAGFVSNSWIHVLEDSEITLLLMIACGIGRLPGPLVAIPADVRLLNYGIARDPYSRARKTLEWFGLVTVVEVDRHSDGKAEGGESHYLHRFEIREEGFEREALPTVVSTLEAQLARK